MGYGSTRDYRITKQCDIRYTNPQSFCGQNLLNKFLELNRQGVHTRRHEMIQATSTRPGLPSYLSSTMGDASPIALLGDAACTHKLRVLCNLH